MNRSEPCRICTVESKYVENLFGHENRVLLTQIESLAGIKLENAPDLPQYICQECAGQAVQAHNFREQVLFSAQKYFVSERPLLKQEPSLGVEEEAISFESWEFLDNFDEVPAEDILLPDVKVLPKRTTRGVIKKEGSDTDDEPLIKLKSRKKARPKCKSRKNAEIEEDTNEDKSQKNKRDFKSKKTDKEEISKLDKEKRKFICEQCGNHFKTQQHFRHHKWWHEGTKNHQCEVCPSKFISASELKRHMRRHTGEKPFACQYCERRFGDVRTRINHERTHTNERPYACQECGKAFTRNSLLKDHMRVHTGERLFQCTLCDRAFKFKTTLQMHNRSILHKVNVKRQQQIQTH